MATKAVGERLVFDALNVDVTFEGGDRILRARLFVTDRRMVVFTESTPPVLAREVRLDGAPTRAGSVGTPQHLSTPEGDVLIRRASGCTCSLPNLAALRWVDVAQGLGTAKAV